jgi:hypothetical protein
MANLVNTSELSIGSIKAFFRLPFRGAEWPLKLLIGILLIFAGYIIPIIPWILISGYGIRVMRLAIEGQAPELPVWDDWGQMAWDGLRATGISLIFFLPGLIILFGGIGLYSLNLFTLPFLAAGLESGEMPGVLFGLTYFLSIGIFFVSMGLGNFLVILASIPLPAVIAHFAATNKFSSIINIGTWIQVLWRNKLGYFIVWVIGLGVFGIIYLLIFFGYFLIFPLCFLPILMPLAIFIILVIMQALFGETYREGILMVD